MSVIQFPGTRRQPDAHDNAADIAVSFQTYRALVNAAALFDVPVSEVIERLVTKGLSNGNRKAPQS